MEYTVTLAMPVYNVQDHIRRSMESALSQTYEDIEFLIIDDCGTDASISIIRDMQKSHLRGQHIRIVSQPRNKGVGEARNRAIDEAKGRYLYFMDADDVIEPNAIETLYEALVRHGAEICFGSHEQTWDFKEKAKATVCLHPYRVFEDNDSFGTYAFRKFDGIKDSSWNILFDLSFLRNTKLRFPPLNYAEDFTLMDCLYTCVNKAVTLPDITYHYICREKSLSNYQKREYIDKSEIEKTVNAVENVKRMTSNVSERSYYPGLYQKLMMTDFYFACAILRHKKKIHPAFSSQEIRNLFHSPVPIIKIMRHRGKLAHNLFLYMLGIVPSALSVAVITFVGKKKGLI